MLSKVNPWVIIRDHVRTLYRLKSKGKLNPALGYDGHVSISLVDVGIFFATPVLISLYVSLCLSPLVPDKVNASLLTAYSIFCALLLSMQMVTYQSLERLHEEPRDWTIRLRIRHQYLHELMANASFATFVSALEIVALVLLAALPSDSGTNVWIYRLRVILSFSVTCGSVSFVLTVLMVLKRVHLLMTNSFNHVPPVKSGGSSEE